jgi:hypothetical protein
MGCERPEDVASRDEVGDESRDSHRELSARMTACSSWPMVKATKSFFRQNRVGSPDLAVRRDDGDGMRGD